MISVFIVMGIIAGLLLQWLLPASVLITSVLSDPLLKILLLCIGLQLGSDLTWLRNLRHHIRNTIIVITAVLVGSLLAGLLYGWLNPHLSAAQSVVVMAGLGFYSLSSAMLAQAQYPELALLALITNMLRELLSFVSTSFLTHYFGPLAPIAAAASASDSGAPVLTRQSGPLYIVPCVASAFVLSLAVPVLITITLLFVA